MNTVGAIADTLVDQQLLPVANSFSVLNEMECSDDTITTVMDKSAILTTNNDGSEK